MAATEAGESFGGTLVHLRQDGVPFTVEVRGRAGIYEGRPCIISSIRDVSGRTQAERQLRQQVVSHAREQATLLEISQILASTLELEPLVILDQLQVIVHYTQATLFVLKDLTLRTIAVRGFDRLEKAMPFGIEIERGRMHWYAFQWASIATHCQCMARK